MASPFYWELISTWPFMMEKLVVLPGPAYPWSWGDEEVGDEGDLHGT